MLEKIIPAVNHKIKRTNGLFFNRVGYSQFVFAIKCRGVGMKTERTEEHAHSDWDLLVF